MTGLLGWILDSLPWWVWLLAGAAILAATYQVWLPLWRLLPSPVRAALIGVAAAALAYLAGRNKGAAGALHRAEEKEQADADRIRDKAREARARADRDAIGGRLRDDDGWRRED